MALNSFIKLQAMEVMRAASPILVMDLSRSFRVTS